jgi:WD40 repeat protein
MSASAAGQLLAVISRDGMVQLYSGETLEPEGRPFPSGLGQFANPQANISLSPNGQTLAVSDADLAANSSYAGRSVSVFSRAGNQWVPDPPLEGDHSRVNAIAFSSDGSVLATASPTPTGSEIMINDIASGKRLYGFASGLVNSGHGAIALDWARHRIVLDTLPGGAGDAVWFDLNSADPTPHVMDVSSSAGVGDAYVGFDSTDSRLGISSSTGFGIFDAATLAPVSTGPVLPNSTPGAFLFLDPVHVLTSLALGGPVSLWDLSGTSVLATRMAAQFDKGVFPFYPTSISVPFIGTSTLDNERSITMLGPGYRPLDPPIPIELNLQQQSAGVQHIVEQGVPAVVCKNPRDGDIATVSVSTGDIIVRDGTPPFRVVTDDPGVAAGLAPYLCLWSPDGSQIAIGSAPAGEGLGGATSVALYDVADKTMRVTPLSGGLGLSSLIYSNDSKTLWAGGVNNNSGVYRLTNLDQDPRATVAFPGASAISADQDGRRLVVAYPTSVRVFDARTLKPLTQPIGLTGTTLIFGVRSAPNGRQAVVNSLQGWRLIDLDAQQVIGPWIPSPPISATSFGPDDTTVYAEAPTGGGERWNLAPSNLRVVACGLAGRNLTQQEWQQYLAWAGPRRATCPQYPLS